MLFSNDAGCGAGAGLRRGALRRRMARGFAFALRAVCLTAFFALRLAGRFAAFFFDVFLFEVLRDETVFLAAFRRFLAMRALLQVNGRAYSI